VVILSEARATARRYARRHPLGLCTVEEVYERLARRGRDLGCLARIAGNIFRTPQWHKTFLRLASRRPAARGREVKVWRLTRSEVEAGAPFGWSVVVDGLVFLWLPDVETAVVRVADRVRKGGHEVDAATVRRRYDRGIRNFLRLYRPIADTWRLYDNSPASGPRLVAVGAKEQVLELRDQALWKQINALQGS
jgi:hypothetical protein